MNHLRVTILFYGLLLFACLGEDSIIEDENTESDMSGAVSVDGSSTPELDMDVLPIIDMMIMVDMAMPCEPEDQRLSATMCGLNDEGFYRDICVEGMWVTTQMCSGMDECENGDQRNGTTPCGPNDEGFLQQFCQEGRWVGSTDCSDSSECRNGENRASELPCGLNNEGFLLDDCVNGQWTPGTTCSGSDVCVNGSRQEGATVCGLNGEGVFFQACENGQWTDTMDCTGMDVCLNDETRESDTPCGTDNEGSLLESCTMGAWQTTDICSGDACEDGARQTEAVACANGDGVRISVCANMTWTTTQVCPSNGAISRTGGGRRLDLTQVDLNETGQNIVTVTPGSTVNLRARGSVTRLNTACPGCITQFYLRIRDVFNLCLGSQTGNWSFDERTNFTAPMEPGIYFINPANSWQFSCVDSTGVSDAYSDQTAGIVIVADPIGENPDGSASANELCDVSGIQAGTGTVTVNTYNDVVLNWATANNAVFQFPDASERFASARMHLTIECPPGGCDPWDRFGNLSLKHSSGETYEIARLVTPYDIGRAGGGPGSCAWSYDVSPYMHLLRGEQELSLFVSTWIGGERGWQISIDFEFERGVPELEPYRVVNLWDHGHLVYGNPNNPVEDHLTTQTVTIEEQAVKAMVRVAVSGHGQGNTDNAAEFSRRWHRIKTTGITEQWTPWRSDCAQNTCSPQGGTWPYGRAGWCPGSGVWPEEFDVSSELENSPMLTIDYEIEPYENCCRPDNPSCNANDGNCCMAFAGECGWNYTGHTEPNFDLNAQLILYRCPQ